MQKNLGLLFDFNGTLVFDSDKHEQAWQIWTEEKCGQRISLKKYHEKCHGHTTKHVVRILTEGKKLSDNEISALAEEKEAIYRQLFQEDTANFKLVSGATEIFDICVKEKIPFTIATVSEKSNVDFYIEEFNLARWFDPQKIVYLDGTFRGKPYPDIYLLAAEKIGIPIENCIVFEDSLPGIQAGHAAGTLDIIGIAEEDQKEALRSAAQLQHVISDFREAMQILNLEV